MFNNLSNKLWQIMIKRMARAHGIIDPVAFSAKLNRFGQPSEVIVPVELIRMSAILHARGLINSRAIQHNLDWIWPYWVVQQFDPKSPSFIPRAFSLTHINLTERNWTAVGVPDCDEFPIIDPRGLVTPLYDGWSLDGWVVAGGNEDLLPSRCAQALQEMTWEKNLSIRTKTRTDSGHELEVRTRVVDAESGLVCRTSFKAHSTKEHAALVISARPYNPEGVSFINSIALLPDKKGWSVNKKDHVLFDTSASRHIFSEYSDGDVYERLSSEQDSLGIKCDVGMGTAAALYPLQTGKTLEVSVDVPLSKKKEIRAAKDETPSQRWQESVAKAAKLSLSDKHVEFLYDAAVRTLVLLMGKDVYPGPYTYKHFWFRDASFMVAALTMIGLTKRAESAINLFFERQKINGYFLSQDGEWDSNGQVLWSIRQFYQMTDGRIPTERREKVKRAVRWVMHKRLKDDESSHSGLFPAGFSAEHFGPNDYYYWDDFWGVEGLRSGAFLLDQLDQRYVANKCRKEAAIFLASIEQSLETVSRRTNTFAIPSSPYRRLDSASIGSLVAAYPLKIWEPGDRRVKQTIDFLLANCFLNNAFYHDMSHSGINPYLTLYVSQVLLRQDDERYYDVMNAIAELASPTGQWPEAIHPNTGEGCMGDGQHAWASAEWIMMMRNCFVREEGENTLILCSGVDSSWYRDGEASFGWLLTIYGKIFIYVQEKFETVQVSWDAQWHDDRLPRIIVKLPGFSSLTVPAGQQSVEFNKGRR